VHLPSDINLNN